jgi:hypothetical protein
MATVIDGLIQRQEAILSYLKEHGELSLALEFEGNFKKLFVMACGSFFENELIAWLENYAAQNSELRLSALIKNKALKRQYFTMFDFDEGRNANKFLSLFGSEFKDTVSVEIRASEIHTRAMKDFLTLGAERNLLAHANLAAMTIDRTLDELKQMYLRALSFVSLLQSKFPLIGS